MSWFNDSLAAICTPTQNLLSIINPVSNLGIKGLTYQLWKTTQINLKATIFLKQKFRHKNPI